MQMVKSCHNLENHPTADLTYDLHYILLLDYKKQFHLKEN